MTHRLFLLLPALALLACQPLAATVPAPPAAAIASAYPEWTGWQAPKITPADYKTRTAAGESFLVIDARPAAPYAGEHIAGAVNVPADQLATLQATLPHDRQLLVYCTCSDEGLSLRVAGELHDTYGFKNLQVILGGLFAWEAAGLPTAGTNPGPSPTATPAPAISPAAGLSATFGLSGQAAPAVSFTDVAGATHTLAEYKGKYALLTFFATWCPHCQAAMPKLQQLHDQSGGKLAWVPLEASQDPASAIADFAKTYKVTAPLFFDTTGALAKAFQIQSFPTSYLLGPDGQLLEGEIGEQAADPAVYAQIVARASR